MSHKEKALKKMLKEVDVKEYNSVMERIHVYLCNTDDQELLEAVLKEDRTILGASMYCYKKGAEIQVKVGNTGIADITPEMEIEFIHEYYLADEIKESDLMNWPKPKGEIKEVIKEVEVIKEIYTDTPSMEHIAAYLAEQQEQKSAKKIEGPEENISLFD